MHDPADWPEELLSAVHRRVFLIISEGYENVAPMPVFVTEADGRVTALGGGAPVPGVDMSVTGCTTRPRRALTLFGAFD